MGYTCHKTKKINLLQKRAVRFVFNEDRLSHSRPLLRKINALNVYQINLYQHLNFMHKFNNQETARMFNDLISNRYINIQLIFQNQTFA